MGTSRSFQLTDLPDFRATLRYKNIEGKTCDRAESPKLQNSAMVVASRPPMLILTAISQLQPHRAFLGAALLVAHYIGRPTADPSRGSRNCRY